MEHGTGTPTTLSSAEAVEHPRAALAAQGPGVLTEADVRVPTAVAA